MLNVVPHILFSEKVCSEGVSPKHHSYASMVHVRSDVKSRFINLSTRACTLSTMVQFGL